MYSRLVKALRKLGEKCTAAGTQVTGDNVDGVVECIAEHYAGGGGSGGTTKYQVISVYLDGKTIRPYNVDTNGEVATGQALNYTSLLSSSCVPMA